MGRTEGRTADDTRRLLLEAAARVIRRDGLAASLDEIANEAGVSKGGLTYHYRSKRALLLALGEHLALEFRARVEDALEEGDAEPGRYVRAYIRASFADAGDEQTLHDNVALAAHLISDPELRPLAEEDGRHWRETLHADGLPSSTVTLIIAATDGVSTGPLWGSALDDSDVRDLEQALIDLTRSIDT